MAQDDAGAEPDDRRDERYLGYELRDPVPSGIHMGQRQGRPGLVKVTDILTVGR